MNTAVSPQRRWVCAVPTCADHRRDHQYHRVQRPTRGGGLELESGCLDRTEPTGLAIEDPGHHWRRTGRALHRLDTLGCALCGPKVQRPRAARGGAVSFSPHPCEKPERRTRFVSQTSQMRRRRAPSPVNFSPTRSFAWRDRRAMPGETRDNHAIVRADYVLLTKYDAARTLYIQKAAAIRPVER
jgi:hypothetical protein